MCQRCGVDDEGNCGSLQQLKQHVTSILYTTTLPQDYLLASPLLPSRLYLGRLEVAYVFISAMELYYLNILDLFYYYFQLNIFNYGRH